MTRKAFNWCYGSREEEIFFGWTAVLFLVLFDGGGCV